MMKLLIFVVIVMGTGLRIVHLLTGDHYYLLGPDSYWFDHRAWMLKSGMEVGVIQSGLVYPVAYLPSSGYWLPMVLFIAGAALIYWFMKRNWGPWPALAGVLCWALLPEVILITSAGWIDRDGLMAVAVSLAIVLYIIWPTRVYSNLVYVVIMVFVAVLWVPLGVVIMIGITGAVMMARLIIERNITNVAYYSVLVFVGITIMSVMTAFDSTGGSIAKYAGYNTGIAETDGLSIATLFLCYGFFIPIVFIAVYRGIRSKDTIQIQLSIWFLVVMVAALFAQRVLLFAVFPASVLSGLLIYQAFQAVRAQSIDYKTKTRLTAILGVWLAVLLSASVIHAYKTGDIRGIAPDKEWQEALSWLRGCDHCVVASHWNYEKWVLDLTKQDTVSCDRYYCPGLASDYVIAPIEANIDLPIAYQNEGVIVYDNRN